jgi:hypothetical protein
MEHDLKTQRSGLWGKCVHWAAESVGAADKDDEVVVKTTRYLRLSMVALVIGLAVSILYEHSKSHEKGGGAGHCWQHSISAYYYTPVQLFFVAALVAIGVTLIALKGNTELEDVFLNFAGLFAPIVAFVPTPNVGSCGSVLTDTTNRIFNIGNNVIAMLVMAGVAFVVLGALALAHHPVTNVPEPVHNKDPLRKNYARRIAIGGYALALVLYVLTWIAFEGHRTWFNDNAHWISAITMFVFIFLVVVENAINFHFTREAEHSAAPDTVRGPHKVNRYLVIAILMAAAVLIITFVTTFGDYRTLWLEASMITLFVVFWVIQTHELWKHGLRVKPGEPRLDKEVLVEEARGRPPVNGRDADAGTLAR